MLPQAQGAGAAGPAGRAPAGRARSSTSDAAADEDGGATTTRRSRALPDDRKQLQRVGEGDARAVPLEPPAQGGAATRCAPRSTARSPTSASKKDGEWVTVGGMIAECKRIRTKKGDPMMFATLDDLEGQVELLVFNSAYAANADKVDVDKLVIVRGRVDHKEAGETKLVAQEVEAFEPEPRRRSCARPRRRSPRRSCGALTPARRRPGVPDTLPRGAEGGRRPPPRRAGAAARRRASGGCCSAPTSGCPATSACQAELSALHGAARVVA